jgi:hypothetical protein
MIANSNGLGPEKDCAGNASSIYKRQTRPLVREGASLTVSHNVTLYFVYGGGSGVEAGSNASTVALRIIIGDQKGTQCLGL